jgi:hypothetical protein
MPASRRPFPGRTQFGNIISMIERIAMPKDLAERLAGASRREQVNLYAQPASGMTRWRCCRN